MKTYTQVELQALIDISKRIEDPPKRNWLEERGSLRNEMQLKAIDRDLDFRIYMRINRTFRENFSAGLDFIPHEGGRSIQLIRCNGPHGGFNRNLEAHPHFRFHIHVVDANRLNSGQDPLSIAQVTNGYGVYEQAIVHLCQIAHVEGFEEYFSAHMQTSLLDSLGEEKP